MRTSILTCQGIPLRVNVGPRCHIPRSYYYCNSITCGVWEAHKPRGLFVACMAFYCEREKAEGDGVS